MSIMNPKDKAENLYLKYRPIIAGKQFLTGIVLMSEAKELTKQCALIAVDELIKEASFEVPNIRERYWQKVKQEINNL